MPREKVSTFWMVYGLGQRDPRFQHPDEASAVREAKRLARSYPEVTFCVLKATHAITFDDCAVDELVPATTVNQATDLGDRAETRTSRHPYF